MFWIFVCWKYEIFFCFFFVCVLLPLNGGIPGRHQNLTFLFQTSNEFTSQNRAMPGFTPSQWETVLLWNDVSHWPGASLGSAPNVVAIHHSDIMMGAMASQITSLAIGYSTVYSGEDQRKHQSSASLAFVWGIHRWPVNSPHKGPVTWKIFSFNDVIMFTCYFNP